MQGNSDWFIALFAPVVIGRGNYFETGFSTVIRKALYFVIPIEKTANETETNQMLALRTRGDKLVPS